MKQLGDVYEHLNNYNKTKASFLREDTLDYPQDAIREALLNCLIHRDYLFTGSIIINVYDDHMEFISLGGLVGGLSLEAVQLGVSQSRNPNLAAIFYCQRLVESYGTGIRKIMRLYEHCPKNRFSRLYKEPSPVSFQTVNEVVQYIQKQERTESTVGESIDSEKQSILHLARQKGSISSKDVEDLVGLKTTKALRLLRQLCDEDQLTHQVSGKSTRYIPRSML